MAGQHDVHSGAKTGNLCFYRAGMTELDDNAEAGKLWNGSFHARLIAHAQQMLSKPWSIQSGADATSTTV